MIKKITEQEFNIVKELCKIKGVDFGRYNLKFNPYLYLDKDYIGFTKRESISTSFDEAVKYLAEIKPKKIVKLNDEYSAEILKDKVMLMGKEFTFDAIEKLYNAIKE